MTNNNTASRGSAFSGTDISKLDVEKMNDQTLLLLCADIVSSRPYFDDFDARRLFSTIRGVKELPKIRIPS
jgi:hypothetical protein